MSVVLHEVEPGSHVVHFYADEDALTSSVAAYAGEGLGTGEAVVLIAEPAHLSAICDALRAQGVDLDADTACGVHLYDAATTLDRFMVDGRPVPERFADTVGGLLRSASSGRAGVRAYGEMVQTLWREGNVPGALALEELWNELSRELSFTLYCAYRDTLVTGTVEETVVDAACRAHSAVVGDGALAPRNSVSRRFAPDESAPAAARTFVLAALPPRDAPLADMLALVVSELATNAVRHSGTDFSVTLSSLAHGVRISVRDDARELPMLRRFLPADLGGRGLRIVDALSRSWGITRRYEGKMVWAELER